MKNAFFSKFFSMKNDTKNCCSGTLWKLWSAGGVAMEKRTLSAPEIGLFRAVCMRFGFDPVSLLRRSESVLSTPVVRVGTMVGIHEKAGYESSLLFGKYMCQNLG